MAVYYKWIKGCAPGATLTSEQWSYITWGTGGENNIDALPTLRITKGRQDIATETDINLGYFLTNAMASPTISNRWNFKAGIKLNDSADIHASIYYFKNENNDDEGIEMDAALFINNSLNVANGQITRLGGSLDVQGKTTLKSLEAQGTATFSSTLQAAGITSTSSCTATYFNATSDKRAKENLKLATYSALDLINKLPIYIYNYKNNTETVTGILAQDLLEAQPKELDLVTNINATGENNDYMSIKQDKLLFVLMKAIQEQQKEINELKSEIAKIKKTN